MEISEATLAAIDALWIERGFSKPDTFVMVRASGHHYASSEARSDPDDYTSRKSFTVFTEGNETLNEQLVRLHKQVATIKPVAEQRRLDFVEKFGRMIDEAREVGMEVDFINPLTEMMKKLSENALENKSGE